MAWVIGAIALILAGCGDSTSPMATAVPSPTTTSAEPTIDSASEIKLMPIEAVEVEIRESEPVQVVVQIRGSLVDTCTAFHTLTQARQGNTIDITLTTIRPKDLLCGQRITSYTTTVTLDGSFPKGSYRVRVNGVERAFTI